MANTSTRCYTASWAPLAIVSAIGLLLFTIGYPMVLCYFFVTRREQIMEDQLLRAKNTGNDRMTNPHAYNLRKTFGRTYYQFKPDAYGWILAILIRKTLICAAIVGLNHNPGFQMSGIMIVLILAFGLQLRVQPYMGAADHEQVCNL
jgi:hypothetical protein